MLINELTNTVRADPPTGHEEPLGKITLPPPV